MAVRDMYQGLDLPLLTCAPSALPMLVRRNETLSQLEFSGAVQAFAKMLPAAARAMNFCADRDAFMVAFCAVLTRGGTNLLPPDALPATQMRLRSLWRDALVIRDRAENLTPRARRGALPDNGANADRLCDLPALLRGGVRGGVRGAVGALELPRIAAQLHAATPFTSGSTGAPQPHPKRWGAMCFVAAATETRFFADLPRYSVVATVPSQHMYGLEMTLMLALRGRALVAAERPLLPSDVAATLARLPEPRVLVTTPMHLRALVRSATRLPKLALVISATAPLSTTLARLTEALSGAEVHEVYGCTEAGALATRRTVASDAWELLDGITIAAAADAAETSANDSAAVHGPHLLSPILLPDRIECLDQRRFRLLGRRGDLINVAGKRASLADLNQKLLDVPGVLDGVIFVPLVPAGGTDEIGRLRGMVVTDGRSERDVLNDLAQQIDAVFLPRPLKKVASIPRNATGKIQHATLASSREATPEATLEVRLDATSDDLRADPTPTTVEFDLPAPAGPWAEDHFPGDTLVPGAVLLAEISAAFRAAWPALGELQSVQSARFLRPVRPPTTLRVTATSHAAVVDFTATEVGGSAPNMRGRFRFGGLTTVRADETTGAAVPASSAIASSRASSTGPGE